MVKVDARKDTREHSLYRGSGWKEATTKAQAMAAERGLKNRAWRRERLELAKMFVSILKRTNLVSVFQKAAQRMAKAAPIQEKAEELQKQLLQH